MTRLTRTRENIEDPLFRFFEREINLGEALLRNIRNDLDGIVAVCQGEQKLDNNVRSLISDLNKGKNLIS